MRTSMPENGRTQASVLEELRARKDGDVDWKRGRTPLYVFKASDEVSDMGRNAFLEYFSENALGGGRAFPSVRQMEVEVVEMALGLLHGSDDAQGFMTTGGTESIIQAVQTCRDWTREQRGDKHLNGNIVAPETVHPAFDKAARLMDLEVRRAPVGADYRADVVAMESFVDDDTIMVVGSAPCFPYGVIDPIRELAAMALRRGIWMHVDACVGGYLAPFARMLGRNIPEFDFALPGVCSMSADLHKYGFCPKPASTVLYSSAEFACKHPFDFNAWPNGRFLTNTLVGTRPAGGVAAAWAVFNFLGVAGYQRIAAELLGFVDAYKQGLEDIPGLRVIGNPHLSIVSCTSDEVDMFKVAECMTEQGWMPGLVQRPRGLHRMMSMVHAPVSDQYLHDLRTAMAAVRKAPAEKSTLVATY